VNWVWKADKTEPWVKDFFAASNEFQKFRGDYGGHIFSADF